MNCPTPKIWHDGAMIGTVTGADGPGVRVISKHPMEDSTEPDLVVTDGRRIGCTRVAIDPGKQKSRLFSSLHPSRT